MFTSRMENGATGCFSRCHAFCIEFGRIYMFFSLPRKNFFPDWENNFL